MTKRRNALLAASAAAALVLAGCAGETGENGSNGDEGSPESQGSITLAVFNGWDEGIATSELWKAILEDEGYDVTLEYADVAPLFAGLSTGDYDFTTDVWLPGTHAEYVEEFGDDMIDLGPWNTEAALTVAVNEDAPIDSLEELAANADAFGNQIVGIEPGAGLTAAMLTELEAATNAGENVVVTLWEPHWAYGAFPIKNLEDPEGALGEAEGLHIFSRTGFDSDFPQVADWLGNFEMSLDQLYDLENLLFVDNDTDDYGPLVDQWIADNQEYVDSLTE